MFSGVGEGGKPGKLDVTSPTTRFTKHMINRVYRAINECARKGNGMALYIKKLNKLDPEFQRYITVLIKEYEERNENGKV